MLKELFFSYIKLLFDSFLEGIQLDHLNLDQNAL